MSLTPLSPQEGELMLQGPHERWAGLCLRSKEPAPQGLLPAGLTDE